MRGISKLVAVNILLLVFCLALAETAARVYGYFYVSAIWSTTWQNIAEAMNIDKLRGSYYPAQFDPIIGHVPKPGSYKMLNGSKLTINSDGTRSNGNKLEFRTSHIALAVGDSFTYGDQVNDQDTWPSYFERATNIRTVNAGVFGFGFGQTVLMAKRKTESYNPDILIVSIIPDDIKRTELSVRTGIAKPLFVADGDKVKLITATENIPKIGQFDHLKKVSAFLRAVFGYSYLVHNIMIRVAPEFWLSNRFSVREHSYGITVSCGLIHELNALAVKHKIILIQYPAQNIISNNRSDEIEAFLNCLKSKNFIVVDTFDRLRAAFVEDLSQFSNLYVGHMSKLGNKMVAQILEKRLNPLFGAK